jgi:cysteinyl-tRNA synthetase
VSLPPPRPGPALPPLVLYNTATKAKAPFTPRARTPGAPAPANPFVSLYCCGVTVYDLSHVGHARVYVSVDILVRVLAAAGYDVGYVRNFTDVDDKIIARAAAEAAAAGTAPDPAGLAERMVTEFHVDMAALGCLPPSAEPRATAFVPAMVAMIQRILDAGHGYVTPAGDVMFDVASLPGYGRLSGRDDLQPAHTHGARRCGAVDLPDGAGKSVVGCDRAAGAHDRAGAVHGTGRA